LRAALKGGQSDPKTVSLIIVYSLSKALGISPLEVYKMPANLIIDLLQVHQVFEEIKAEELEKASKAK
tara:strand:+ start:228 stop:431 length:204 start_codon:yes stop_codon:yes gene_type:complete